MPGLLTWDQVSGDHRKLRLVVTVGGSPSKQLMLPGDDIGCSLVRASRSRNRGWHVQRNSAQLQHLVASLDPMTDAYRIAEAAITTHIPSGATDARW